MSDRDVLHAAVVELTELLHELRHNGRDTSHVESRLRQLANRLAKQ